MEVDQYYWPGVIVYKRVCRRCGLIDEKSKTEKGKHIWKFSPPAGGKIYRHYLEKSKPSVWIIPTKEERKIMLEVEKEQEKQYFKEEDEVTEKSKDK